MTRVERRQLQVYLHFRDRLMSPARLVLFNWRALLATYGFCVAAACYFYCSHQSMWAAGFVGAALAGLFRDFGNLMRWSRAWPLVRSLLDWSKLEQVAADNGVPPNNSSKPTPLRGAA